jgi:hypothetical protein
MLRRRLGVSSRIFKLREAAAVQSGGFAGCKRQATTLHMGSTRLVFSSSLLNKFTVVRYSVFLIK